MGFRFDVMFIDSFMDDVAYVRDVEVCVERMICYIPECTCYGSENFGLGSVHDKYEGHFINNAHYFFYLRVYFILGSISLQSFYVVPLLLNHRVPTFRKIFYSM